MADAVKGRLSPTGGQFHQLPGSLETYYKMVAGTAGHGATSS